MATSGETADIPCEIDAVCEHSEEMLTHHQNDGSKSALLNTDAERTDSHAVKSPQADSLNPQGDSEGDNIDSDESLDVDSPCTPSDGDNSLNTSNLQEKPLHHNGHGDISVEVTSDSSSDEICEKLPQIDVLSNHKISDSNDDSNSGESSTGETNEGQTLDSSNFENSSSSKHLNKLRISLNLNVNQSDSKCNNLSDNRAEDVNTMKIKEEPVDLYHEPVSTKYEIHSIPPTLKYGYNDGNVYSDMVNSGSSLFTASFVNMNTCQLCGRVFSRAEHLQRHIWIVHGVDRYGKFYDPVVEELERKQALYEKKMAEERSILSGQLANHHKSFRSVAKENSINTSTDEELDIVNENVTNGPHSSEPTTKAANSEKRDDHVHNDSDNKSSEKANSATPESPNIESFHDVSRNHMKTVPFPFRLATQCHICGRIYSKGAHLRNHLHVAHGLSGDDALPDPIQEELLRKQALFECNQQHEYRIDQYVSPKVHNSSSTTNVTSPKNTNLCATPTSVNKRIKSPLSDTTDNILDDQQNNFPTFSTPFSTSQKKLDIVRKLNTDDIHKSAAHSFLYGPECKFCGRHFFRLSLLEKHMWRVHGVDRFGNVDDPIIAELSRKRAMFEDSYDDGDMSVTSGEKENQKPDVDDERLINISSSNDKMIFVKTETVKKCYVSDLVNRSPDERFTVSCFDKMTTVNSSDDKTIDKTFSDSHNFDNSSSNASSPETDSDNSNNAEHFKQMNSIRDIDLAKNRAVRELVNFAVQDGKESDFLSVSNDSETIDYDQIDKLQSSKRTNAYLNYSSSIEDQEHLVVDKDGYISDTILKIQRQNSRPRLLLTSKSTMCSCPFCDKVCSRPVQLQRHIFRIHGVDKYGNIDDPIAAELVRKQNMFERRSEDTLDLMQNDTLDSSNTQLRITTPPILKNLASNPNLDYSLVTFGDVEVLTMKSQVVCSDSLGWKAMGSIIKEPRHVKNGQHTQENSDDKRQNELHLQQNSSRKTPERGDIPSSVAKSSGKKRSSCLDQIAERLQKRAKLLSCHGDEDGDVNTDNPNSNLAENNIQSDLEECDSSLNSNIKSVESNQCNQMQGKVENLITNIKTEPLSPSSEENIEENHMTDIQTFQKNELAQDHSYQENAEYFRNVDNLSFDGSFRCHICGKCVARKPNLQKHLQRIHGLDKHGREIDPIAEELARKQALFEHKPLYETVSSILNHEEQLIQKPLINLPIGHNQRQTLPEWEDYQITGDVTVNIHVNTNSHDSVKIKVEPQSPILGID